MSQRVGKIVGFSASAGGSYGFIFPLEHGVGERQYITFDAKIVANLGPAEAGYILADIYGEQNSWGNKTYYKTFNERRFGQNVIPLPNDRNQFIISFIVEIGFEYEIEDE